VVKAAVFAVPGDLATPTGGYAYDRRIVTELAAIGWTIDVLDLGDGFPRPTKDQHAAASARLAALPRDRPIVVDGLAFGVLPQAAEALRQSHALVALVHHPLALEAGLSVAEAAQLRASERAALACTLAVVTTSSATARLLVADYGVAPDRLMVVEPGTDRIIPRADQGSRKCGEGPIELLAVGSIVPRKGYDVLVAALAELRHLPWRLTIVGDADRSPATTLRLERDIARLAVADRISLRGAVSADELALLYAAADMFVLPSRFEGYGMACAEAIANGVPVLATTAGAIPETVPPAAGVLVPPDDIAGLAAALHRLIGDPGERARLADGARATRFPSWGEQGARFAQVLQKVLQQVLERLP
jgi:glycosyltransferase involved in cell wall biosynthesis